MKLYVDIHMRVSTLIMCSASTEMTNAEICGATAVLPELAATATPKSVASAKKNNVESTCPNQSRTPRVDIMIKILSGRVMGSF